MFSRFLTSLAALTIATQAHAVGIAPGETLISLDYVASEVADGDPNWFGTLLDTVSRSATETRDGVVGPGPVIPGLYSVTGQIDAEVHAATNGGMTFSYGFSAIDNSGAGNTNGVATYSVSGFAGWSVDVGWNYDALPYIPIVSRSNDGDTISVTYFAPQDTLQAFGAPFERILLHTTANAYGLTGSGQVDINIDSFGVTPRTLDRLPAPSAVPLPLPAAGLLGALGLLAAVRRQR